MSDQQNPTPEAPHQLFGIWAQEEETDKKAFVIRCACGETIYYLEKDLFGDSEKIYPGMTINDFQKMQKKAQKLRGMKKQVQRVALAQHAEAHPDCPAIKKLKDNAGVSSVLEMPNPFHDLD